MKFSIIPSTWTLARDRENVFAEVKNASRSDVRTKPYRTASPWEGGPSGAGGGRLTTATASGTTSESTPAAGFSSWKLFCHQRKMLFPPHLITWTFAKLNALRGWEPTSTEERAQTALSSACLRFLENRPRAMENVVEVSAFMLGGKPPFLSPPLASRTGQGEDQLSEKSLVQNPAELSAELCKQ